MSDDCRAARGEREPAVLDTLPRLKRRGCNLLVTGTVSEATANRATRRLLGAPDVERKRILVRTVDAPPVAELLPTGVTADDSSVRVFDYRPTDAERDAFDSLGGLVSAVSSAIDDFASRSTPLVGGELRLSVPSLGSLVATHDAASVERFLRRLTDAIVGVRGMGHYRYPGPRVDVATLPLDRLFDGFVDLREHARPQHRVSLSTTPPTEWVDL
jgi:hypothetical protein